MNEIELTITEKASTKLREIAAAEGNSESSFRMAVVRTHCMGGRGFSNQLVVDLPKADDSIIKQDGIQLCVDRASSEYLKGSAIDYIQSDGKEGFSVNNPNVKSKCPCGRHDIFD